MGFRLPRIADEEDPLRLAVLISGSGSGMAALLRHQESPVKHRTRVVISNVEGVAGLQKAEEKGIEAIAIPHGNHQDRESHERAIHAVLLERDVEAVILSGYMRLLTPWFVERWEGRLLNIHPSLLPDFPGAHAHRDVIAAGVSMTGCTVHFVDKGMDSGRIIAQADVPVLPGDDENSLQERVKGVEHILYPMAIDALACGDLEEE